MADSNNNGQDDRVKKFLNWVNADEDLPSLEELGYSQDEEDISDHDEEDSENQQLEASRPAVQEEMTEDYEDDDEFTYPDEVADTSANDAGEEDEHLPEEECITGDDDAFIVHHEAVHMTKHQKLQMKRFRIFYLILSAVVALNVIVILLITVNYLPEFGSEANPAVNEVYLRYVEMGLEETGALNMVAAVLFSYRSFDTLGEAFVLFTAVIGVIILMRKPDKNTY
ncbi:MAG: hypothetical protein FWE20_07250 [Defluviitaleaceae bacterium]|nr:hypothetical protein [Defluviitaleaceae bacterium]